MNQQKTRPKSAPVNNSGPKNRRNPKSPGQAAEKNSGSRSKSASKQTSPLQNKLNRNPSNNAGKKKPPRKQQRKNWLHNSDSPVTPLYLYDITHPSTLQTCQPGTTFHGHPTWPSSTSRNDTNNNKNYDHYLDLG